LTSLDYHKALGILLTTCEGGSLKIWNHDKKFMREMTFPGKIQSACFCDGSADILVSHD
jgi:hypothetical protein